MKYEFKDGDCMKAVYFLADDVNDEQWDDVVEALRNSLPKFDVGYLDGHRMAFYWEKGE